jgi:hypothetical protein
VTFPAACMYGTSAYVQHEHCFLAETSCSLHGTGRFAPLGQGEPPVPYSALSCVARCTDFVIGGCIIQHGARCALADVLVMAWMAQRKLCAPGALNAW